VWGTGGLGEGGLEGGPVSARERGRPVTVGQDGRWAQSKKEFRFFFKLFPINAVLVLWLGKIVRKFRKIWKTSWR
jgi:hypothetical protein